LKRRVYAKLGINTYPEPTPSRAPAGSSVRNGVAISGRRERRRCNDRTADQIAAALALIRCSDERWHGLAKFLANSGMDRDVELLDRLAARATRKRYRAEAMASRRRES
jgi:hypothetical protein